jgi:secretion/DNA translocation related TadE-like protein
MNERGSASLLIVGVAGLVLVLAVLVVDVGVFLAARLQAEAAADAAALAAAPVTFRPFGAAGTPAQEAARFASANGTRLVVCRCPLDPTWNERGVEVVVERWVHLVLLGDHLVRAASRAEFDPGRLVGS